MKKQLNFTELDKIEAIGNFIATYYTDLKYIQKFQYYKNNIEKQIEGSNYYLKSDSSFYSFLTEFRIIRNIQKDKTLELFNYTLEYINNNALGKPEDVEIFANFLKVSKITNEKLPVSLSSKIMFLNDPLKFFPMDRLTRHSLNLSKNNYKDYNDKLESFKIDFMDTIYYCIQETRIFTDVIHENINNLYTAEELEIIKKNRIIDKLLWTKGKK